MLIDDVRQCLVSGYLSVMPEAPELRSRIDDARCWILDDDVTRAAANLSFMRPSNMLKNMGFARAPAPVTWIEYPAPVRDRFESETFGLGVRDGAVSCEKVGMLIREIGEGPTYRAEIFWRVKAQDAMEPSRIGLATHHLVWSLEEPPENIVGDLREQAKSEIYAAKPAIRRHLHLNDPVEVEAQVKLSAAFTCELRGTIRDSMVDVTASQIRRARSQEEIDEIVRTTEKVVSDIGDAMHEAPFLVAILLLLNATNAVQARDSDLTKLNRSRAKSGKKPLKEHSVVSMRLTKVQSNRMKAQGVTGDTRRYHWATGHFKAVDRRVLDDRGRPTGAKKARLVWWMDQWRGDITKGISPVKTKVVKA